MFGNAGLLWLITDIGDRTLLESRQVGTLPAPPPQCANVCTPVANILNVGCTPTSCCASSFVNGFFNCYTCVGNATDVTDYTTIQQNLDSLVVECTSLGFTEPKLTFPGQNPNRPLSSIAPSGTSAGGSSSTRAPGLPISTGPAATSNSSLSSPPQTTITSLSGPPTPAQNTITSSTPTTTSATSSGARTMSIQYVNIVLVSSTVLTGLSFYLIL
ncbi:hypothetical protein BDN70DRAFT_882369 [Pholiota conissans]|uniref:Uncharacterized protein n=1 Tax=Pholiota conissans TaxID=109636 RepID=A0A9P6CXC8_9AGAR|nr:hypothetical protein BDN70DRAFT_882369 [Pholiota conissans]